MLCKNCGNEIDDNSLFCNKCGIKIEKTLQNEKIVQKNIIETNKNGKTKTYSKKNKIFKKIISIFEICGIIGASIFLCIVLVGLIAYGDVYLHGSDIVTLLSNISIVLMMVGLLGFIANILIIIFKLDELPHSNIKKILSIILIVACIGFPIWGYKDFTQAYAPYVEKPLTMTEVITRVKTSKDVQNEIARVYDMKFYYVPDWGTVTATKDGGTWTVIIKGTISGYTDDYKTDFVYNKKFTATVIVFDGGLGFINEVRVKKD